MPKSSHTKNLSWFGSAESLLVVSSFGGSVATLVFQQVAFAAATSLSLSLAVSLNSFNNRRRWDEVNQQRQDVVSQLEQQYSKEREFLNQAIRYLPTRSEQVEIESRFTRFEAHNTDITSRIEGQVEDLERHIHNSLPPDLKHQVVEVQQLVKQLQTSTVGSTSFHQYLSNEIQSLHQQVQTLAGKISHITLQEDSDLNSIRNDIKCIYELLDDVKGQTTSAELADNSLLLDLQHQLAQAQLLFNQLKVSNKDSNQLTRHIAGEIQPLQKQVQSLSINVSKRLEKVQAELQSRLLALEESDRKLSNDIYQLSNRFKEINPPTRKPSETTVVDPPTTTQYACEHCSRNHKNKPIQGGEFLNHNFCSYNCKREYERRSGLL